MSDVFFSHSNLSERFPTTYYKRSDEERPALLLSDSNSSCPVWNNFRRNRLKASKKAKMHSDLVIEHHDVGNRNKCTSPPLALSVADVG